MTALPATISAFIERVNVFIGQQQEINAKLTESAKSVQDCLDGTPGEDGIKTIVRLHEERLEALDATDKRRKAIIDSLTIALAMAFLAQILQLITK